MENLAVSFSANTIQLAIIEKWLAEEYQIKKEGFYVNWYNSALPSHAANRLAILSKESRPIGFMTWFFENERVAEIQLAEIEPGQRKKDYGKYLLDAVLKKLSQSGIRVARLHCQPADSERVWKKLGFSEFPDFKAFSEENSREGKHLFKILDNAVEVLNDPNGKSELIELWAGQPCEISTEKPQWSWQLQFISGSNCLEIPVIAPAHYEWRIKWTSNGVVVHDDKIKYFPKIRLDFSDFLVINELPLKA